MNDGHWGQMDSITLNFIRMGHDAAQTLKTRCSVNIYHRAIRVRCINMWHGQILILVGHLFNMFQTLLESGIQCIYLFIHSFIQICDACPHLVHFLLHITCLWYLFTSSYPCFCIKLMCTPSFFFYILELMGISRISNQLQAMQKQGYLVPVAECEFNITTSLEEIISSPCPARSSYQTSHWGYHFYVHCPSRRLVPHYGCSCRGIHIWAILNWTWNDCCAWSQLAYSYLPRHCNWSCSPIRKG